MASADEAPLMGNAGRPGNEELDLDLDLDADHEHEHEHEHSRLDSGQPSRPSDGDDGSSRRLRRPQSTTKSEVDDRPGLFVWLLTLAAGISGLLFGYDTGVISATLVSINTDLSSRPLTSLDKSLITSSTALAALIASPCASRAADALGRRRVLLFADALFVLGALLQAGAGTVTTMVAGRAVVGLGVGAASLVVPLYLAEVAPAAHRGRLVTMNVLFITLGQVAAYVVGWLLAQDEEAGWRWMVGLGALPALAQAVLIGFMPETPRWLVMAGRFSAARSVAGRVAGGDSAAMWRADALVKQIQLELREEDEARRLRGAARREGLVGRWGELLAEGRNRRALAIACLLQGLQQLCGFNSLMYFSATIFSMVGFRTPTLTSLTVAVTNFVFTVAALLLIDRIGRRRILLGSLPFMVAGLVLSAVGFAFIDVKLGPATTTVTSEGTEAAAAPALSERNAAVVVLLSIMAYVAAYALGLGNVPWMQSELFPLAVRSLGSGVATATNWGANFVIGLTFLPLMELLSPSGTFLLYAGVCAAGWLLIWRIYPETAGLSLEQATALLDDGWGVR